MSKSKSPSIDGTELSLSRDSNIGAELKIMSNDDSTKPSISTNQHRLSIKPINSVPVMSPSTAAAAAIAASSSSIAKQTSQNWGKGVSELTNFNVLNGFQKNNWGKNSEQSKRFNALQRITREVVETEKTYVNGLNTLMTAYIGPMKESAREFGLKSTQVDSVFIHIEPIANFHCMFLRELEKGMSLADVINKYGDFLKMYTQYISDYDTIVRQMGEMKQKSRKFSEFLDNARLNPQCNNLDLMSFMIMPIQRIPRYELLLRELMSSTEKDNIDEYRPIQLAMEKIQRIAGHVNESRRDVENMSTLFEIQDRIQGFYTQLIQPHRRLIREEAIIQKTNQVVKKKHRILFLFTDMLLWTSPTHTYKGHVILETASICDNAKHPEISFDVQSLNDNSITTWVCASAHDKSMWMNDIQQALHQLFTSIASRIKDPHAKKMLFTQVTGQSQSSTTANTSEMLKQARICMRNEKQDLQRSAVHTMNMEKLIELKSAASAGADQNMNSVPPFTDSPSSLSGTGHFTTRSTEKYIKE